MAFLGGLIDSFTGAGAQKALREGVQNQVSTYGQTRDQQVAATKAGGAEARGYFQPYAQQGGRAYNLYSDTLGVNGADARSRAQDLYNSDDMLARQRDLDLKRTNQSLNAGGNYNRSYSTGPQSLADSRVRLQGYGDWQNRLMQGGQTGYSAAGNLAGIAQNEGSALSGIYGNYGANVGNAYGQNAQAMAQANNVFAQNLLGLGGALVSGYTGMRRPVSGVNNLAGYSKTYGFVDPNNNDPALG